MVKGMKKAAYNKEPEVHDEGPEDISEMTLRQLQDIEKDLQKDYGKDAKLGGYVRVQARVSRSNYDLIVKEAYRTGTSVSAIASIFIADHLETLKKREDKKTANTEGKNAQNN